MKTRTTATTFTYNGDEVKTPEWGEYLGTGFNKLVISYTHKHDGGNGSRPWGIVLAKTSGGMSEVEFVTWTCYYNEYEKCWCVETGHYFTSIVEAAIDYTERGGK